ncbi:GntR family transcriptional regulator [Ohessyouella blattaphilus]|uniref:GntR family transcriptional regulator n=1 Tax=Ohessyouella blattaphilus TaxID=2949333 RepID=A0ABT1EI81_9FIRM|nr:GntR family transcriptional regulator [Ohessyouella blattaphilus]MCP1110409.1 GntR family transcriptional regulator [Ohessyouella blattaphilus]MCR8563803.1 GntR family transcriptional regulator [Ohessyouella blattaphilus]
MNRENEGKEYSIQSDEVIDYHMPIYLQLREIIRSKIEEGEYMPGTAIPSENKLADTFGINRLTVRNAVEALANEGILQRVQGKGVFVVGNKYEEALEEHGGFISALSTNQRRETVKELAKGLRPAGDKFANYFDIEPDAQIFYVKHFTSIGDDPISMEEIYVPKEILPELEVVNTSVFTMKDIFAFYDIELYSMRQTLEVIDGMPKTRKMLNVPDGAALFMLASDYFDKRGQSIGYSTSFVRSDKSSFSIKMH